MDRDGTGVRRTGVLQCVSRSQRALGSNGEAKNEKCLPACGSRGDKWSREVNPEPAGPVRQ